MPGLLDDRDLDNALDGRKLELATRALGLSALSLASGGSGARDVAAPVPLDAQDGRDQHRRRAEEREARLGAALGRRGTVRRLGRRRRLGPRARRLEDRDELPHLGALAVAVLWGAACLRVVVGIRGGV